jgi:hypothetical protein
MAFLACGGRTTSGPDGGTGGAGGGGGATPGGGGGAGGGGGLAQPDATVSVCSQGIGTVTIGQSYCSAGIQYSCGPDTYQVGCDCPKKTCTCILNNGSPATLPYEGCPGCTLSSQKWLATSCAFPY